MVEIILLQPSEWKMYKIIRLEALQNDPQAFFAQYDEWVDFSDEKWQERSNNADSMIFVAKDESTPIGLLGVYMKMENGELFATLWGTYINSAYRGTGLGKKLMNTAIESIKKTAKIRRIALTVDQEPTPAQKLYKSLGFQVVGTTEYILGDGRKHEVFKMELLLQ